MARPWSEDGTSGASESVVFYDLNKNPYEQGDYKDEKSSEATELINELLRIHNQGYSRPLETPNDGNLILDDGWHNLRNDLTGWVGYEFELMKNRFATHLGMWDDHDREKPVRPARNIPSENDRDQPSRAGKKPRSLKSHHTITLWEIKGKIPNQITSVEMNPGTPGKLDGEFRYLELDGEFELQRGRKYLLTMTTKAGDGDHFHDPVAYDGLSPVINPSVRIIRSLLFRDGNVKQAFAIPSFADLHSDYSAFGFPSDQPFDSKPTPSNKLADEVEKHVPIQVFFDIWDIVDI